MATFSYDVALEPKYIDFIDIGSGYGILSIPIDGFLPEDAIGAVTLVIAPRSGSGDTISKSIDMVQRTDGYFEYTAQDAISAHFTLTPDDLETINAGTYGYTSSVIVTRSENQRTREVQAGNIAARPAATIPPLMVAEIVITGGPITGDTGDTGQLTAEAFDAYGNEIAGQVIVWSSANPLVAQVDQSGLVTFLIPGVTTITAAAQGIQDTTSATSQDPAFDAPLDGQVATYDAGDDQWRPEYLRAAAMRPGTFGGAGTYTFPDGVVADSFAGDGSDLTGLDMANAATGQLAVARGGTGLGTMGAIGAILYASAALTLAALAGNTSATKKFLSQTGDGVASAAPTWAQLATTDISDLTTAATGVTRVGTLTTGVWHASAIDDAYLATIATAGKVSNSATTATAANTASAIVARDGSGNFSAGTITATFSGNGALITALNASAMSSGAIGVTVGGTGQSAVATGDLLFGSATNTWSRLGGNTAASRQLLVSVGNGVTATAPVWGALVAGDIPDLNASKITAGTLDEAIGGTGHSSYDAGDLLYASGPTALARLAGNPTTTRLYLSQSGNGAVPGAPQWWNIEAEDLGGGTFDGDFTWEGASISTTYTDAKIKTVTGTANRLTIAGTATDPTFDVSTAYVGQATITTLGTIATGVWNGTVVAQAFGGTGFATYALGDLLYASATNTLSKLAGNITVQPKFLMQTGTSSVSAAPEWHTMVVGDLTDITTAATGITKVGTLTTGTWQATVVDPTYGGTGVNNGARTLTLAGNLVTSGASSITLTSTGATNVTLPTSGTLATTAGNVATATALQTARTIWGQSFDGTGNVSGSIAGATTGAFSGIVTASGFTVSAAVGKILPGATSLSLRNTADNADNLLLADSGAATFRSTVGGITTLTAASLVATAATVTTVTATSLGGTLTTATQNGVTTMTGLTTVGVLAAPHMTAAVIDSGGLTVTAGGVIINAPVTAQAYGLIVNGATDAGLGLSRTGVANTTDETFIAMYAFDIGTNSRKVMSISSKWVSTNATTGYSVARFNSDYIVAGATTDDIQLRLFGGHGAAFFGPDDATSPGDKILKVHGRAIVAQPQIDSASNVPAFSVTADWNSPGTAFTGLLFNVTNTASLATSMLADLQVGGVSSWKVDRAGNSTQTGEGLFGARVRIPYNVPFVAVNQAGSSAFELLKLVTLAGVHNLVELSPDGQDIVWGRAVVALGGGAAATLGTVGGSGPATAAQNAWLPVRKSDGTPGFVPFFT